MAAVGVPDPVQGERVKVFVVARDASLTAAEVISHCRRFLTGYKVPREVEFRDSLHLLAEGKVNAAPIVTGTVGLGGVDGAFTALADPETHAKILIDPAR